MIDRDETIELLKKVISINSMNPSLFEDAPGENELAEFLGNHLEKLGLEIKYQEREERKNVIGVLKGKGTGKSIILNAHTDTVGVEGMENPCIPVEKDGKIYGRGAYDMKGGMVSCLMAIKSIVDRNIQLSGDIIFAGVTDEEFASIGTEGLVSEYTADAGIICEPTNEKITIANKGWSILKITLHGKASHGSKPHLGIDAIAKANNLMVELNSLQKEYNKKRHDLVGAPLIRVTKIEGGLGLSTVPDKCTLHLEIRPLPSTTQEEVEEEIKGILSRMKIEDKEFEADYEMIIFRGGLELDDGLEIVQILKEELEKVTGRKQEFAGEPWWMDSALMADHNIPTVVLGPRGDGAHAKVEYVEIDSVVSIAEIIENTIIKYCK